MTMQFIASYTVTASGGDASVTFSSIPQTFTHLQLRIFAKGTNTAASNGWAWFKFNSASSGTSHSLWGDGANPNVASYVSVGSPNSILFPRTTSTLMGIAIIDILDYTNTNKNKVARVLAGYDANGSGTVQLSSCTWADTTAISSIYLNPWDLANFAQGSRFDLYGITTSDVTGA